MRERDRKALGGPVRNEVAGAVLGPSVQAGTIYGDVRFGVGGSRALPKPAQLMAPPRHFTDRVDEAAELSHAVADRNLPSVVVITGVGGVGKTALASWWLHRIRDDYADGQLFADLRGFLEDESPSSSEPLAGFLRALGVAVDDVPADPVEQSALFRSLTAGRRVIVMLDNVASAAQVRPLLPGGPAVVMVTTRHALPALAVLGASFLELGPLDQAGAVQLLGRILGESRLAAEWHEACRLAELCGHLPLALCTAAARLTGRRRWPIVRVVEELNDEQHRLSALNVDEEVSVRAVFDVSYAALDEEAARAYRLLGLHPGRDFDVAAAAALLDVAHDRATSLVEALMNASLLEENPVDRFAFHDLLRLHAADKARHEETEGSRTAAMGRLIAHYLTRAVSADHAVMPTRVRLGEHYADLGDRSVWDQAEALVWLESELPNLTAVVRAAHDSGRYRQAWQMCEALWGVFIFRKHYRKWIDTHRIGLAAATACGDSKAQARMLEQLGTAHLNLHDFDVASDYGTRALQLEIAACHQAGEATASEVLGLARLGLKRPEEAIGYFTRARALLEGVGSARGVAIMDRRLGEALRDAGRHAEALECFTRAHRYFVDVDDRYNQVRALAGGAETYIHMAADDRAYEALHTALAIATDIGALREIADTHLALADLATRAGDIDTERHHLRMALDGYTNLDVPRIEHITRRLAEHLDTAPGSTDPGSNGRIIRDERQ